MKKHIRKIGADINPDFLLQRLKASLISQILVQYALHGQILNNIAIPIRRSHSSCSLQHCQQHGHVRKISEKQRERHRNNLNQNLYVPLKVGASIGVWCHNITPKLKENYCLATVKYVAKLQKSVAKQNLAMDIDVAGSVEKIGLANFGNESTNSVANLTTEYSVAKCLFRRCYSSLQIFFYF